MDQFTGRSPNQILTNPFKNHSSWHFFQARSWLDYAIRSGFPSAIHYAAFELRYGVEYLLFELLVLASESLTQHEYENVVGKPTEMKRMLSLPSRNYKKLAEFCKVLISLDSAAPNLCFWDINDLFRYWGAASKYLHFVGAHELTYADSNWLIEAIARLGPVLEEIWNALTPTIGIGLMKPSKMRPEVHQAWVEFAAGTLSRDNLILRLQIIRPALQLRRLKMQ